jgi:hypothetical protein
MFVTTTDDLLPTTKLEHAEGLNVKTSRTGHSCAVVLALHLLLVALLVPLPAIAQEGRPVSPNEPLTTSSPTIPAPLRDDEKIELHRIRIVNRNEGAIQVSLDTGKTWETVGRVVAPAIRTAPGYKAVEYAPQGTIAATAVHGLRIRVGGDDPNENSPTIIGVEPAEYASRAVIDGKRPNKGFGGYISGAAGIFTDIPAGRSIFRGLAPLPGNPVFLETVTGRLTLLPDSFAPTGTGEVFVIVVQAPKNPLVALTIENKSGGMVEARFADGMVRQVTGVIRPVKGIGRFDGTAYTGVGKINTAHTGVVTVATVPEDRTRPEGVGKEQRGGFQICPEWHNSRTEEFGAPQVLTVGSPGARRREQEGLPPLFRDTISLDSEGAKVEVSIDEGPWEPMPILTGLRPTAFTGPGLTAIWQEQGIKRKAVQGVTAFRIILPSPTPERSASGLLAAASAYRKLRLLAAQGGRLPIVNGRLTINANPSNSANVSMVRFSVEGMPRGFTNIPPFTITWDTTKVPDGEYLIEAEALDPSGATIATSRRRVYVLNNEPAESPTPQ